MKYNVGLLGYGHVGSGVYEIVTNSDYLKDKVKIQCSYNNELFEVFEFTLRGLY